MVFLLTSVTALADFTGGGARVLGVGRIQNVPAQTPVTPTERLILPSFETHDQAVVPADLATPIDRDIAINEPTPVFVSQSGYVDQEGSYSGEWSSGLASGYGDGWIGLSTADGTILTEDGMCVAVPAAWGYLLGRTIQVEYNGIVITTTINDTGGFAIYGRVLDLQPGIWRAFGFDNEYDWGVRTVRYRIIY